MSGGPLTLDELITPLSRQEVQASIYQTLAALGVNTTTWKPGAVTRAMITGCSLVLAGLSSLQAQIARAGFLEHSEGKWLTLVARYVYGVERLEATYASGTVRLTNAGGGVFSLGVDDLVVSNPATGVSYRNTAPIELGAVGSLTAVLDIEVRAIEAGASISLPGTITAFTTPLLRVTCSNAAAFVGLEAELDPALRLRCSEKLGALSPMGPWDAYASAVRNARTPTGEPLGITRQRIRKDGYGNVFVYLANAGGEVPSTDIDIADEAIQQWASPLSVTPHTLSASAVAIAVTYELWMYSTSGLTEAQIEALIAKRLVQFFQAQPIGGNVISGGAGKIYADAIRVAIGSALPQIFHAVVSLPAADISLAINQVPILGTATKLAVHTAAPPEGFAA